VFRGQHRRCGRDRAISITVDDRGVDNDHRGGDHDDRRGDDLHHINNDDDYYRADD